MIKSKTNIYHSLCILVTAAILGGCSDELQGVLSTPIRLEASSMPMTRYADTDCQTANFEKDAKIKAYITADNGNVIIGNPTILTAQEATQNMQNRLVPDVQPYYPNSDVAVEIHALYPADKITSGNSPFTFSVEEDQTGKLNYENSDLMYAELKNQVRTTSAVNLNFTHKMAKVIVNATAESSITITGVKLINISRSIDVDPATGELSNLGVVTGQSIATDNNGAVLLPPQSVNGDFIEVTVTTDGGVTHEKAKFSLAGKYLTSGKEYTASVYVNRQSIGFTSSIADWTVDVGSTSVVPGSAVSMKISEIPTQTYTGAAVTPEPTITKEGDDTPLTLNEHYRLQYFNNINAGTGSIIVTGLKDPLANMVAVKTFTIRQKDVDLKYESKPLNGDGYFEDEFLIKGTVSNSLNLGDFDETYGTINYISSNNSVARVNTKGVVTKTGVGKATITATLVGDKNYVAKTAQYHLQVTERDASHLSVSLGTTSYAYDGKPHMPGVTVKDTDADGEEWPVIEGKGYTVSVGDIISASSKIVVTVTGIGNYSGQNTTASFEITKPTPTITMDNSNVTLALGSKIQRPASTAAYLGPVALSSSNESVVTVSPSGEVTAVSVGTAKITATVAETGNNESASLSYTVTVVDPNRTFNYTGNVQPWKCPVTGYYKLECMGAEGASATYTTVYGTTAVYKGGKGAHIVGRVKLNENDQLYVYVGGQGELGGTTGGWNGGGKFTGTSGSGENYCGGGGASDISFGNGTWDSDSHLYTRIIVAGGGGGALVIQADQTVANGGGGGAYIGESGMGTAAGGGGKLNDGGASGGTNGLKGSFGSGGNYSGSLSVGLGGGGWYGGGSGGDNNTHGSGGGGSSYVWNSANTSSYPTKAGITKPSISYYITELSKTANTHSGNGQVKITYISAE